MALQHFYDFNGPAGIGDWAISTDAVMSTSYGEIGNGITSGDNSGDFFRINIPDPQNTIILGTRVRFINPSGGETRVYEFEYNDGSSVQIRIPNGVMSLWFNGVNVATAPKSLNTNDFYTVEIKVTSNATTGAVEVRVNDETLINETNIATQNGTDSTIKSVLMGSSASTTIDRIYVDRYWVIDTTGTAQNDFMSDLVAEWILPNGNGNYSQLTGSDGNSVDNYQLVDENPGDGTEYVSGDTEGEKDTYAYSDFTSFSGLNIVAVQPWYQARKPGGGARYIRPSFRISGVDYTPATSRGTSASWRGESFIVPENPATATDWTLSDVDSLEVGPEIRDS